MASTSERLWAENAVPPSRTPSKRSASVDRGRRIFSDFPRTPSPARSLRGVSSGSAGGHTPPSDAGKSDGSSAKRSPGTLRRLFTRPKVSPEKSNTHSASPPAAMPEHTFEPNNDQMDIDELQVSNDSPPPPLPLFLRHTNLSRSKSTPPRGLPRSPQSLDRSLPRSPLSHNLASRMDDSPVSPEFPIICFTLEETAGDDADIDSFRFRTVTASGMPIDIDRKAPLEAEEDPFNPQSTPAISEEQKSKIMKLGYGLPPSLLSSAPSSRSTSGSSEHSDVLGLSTSSATSASSRMSPTANRRLTSRSSSATSPTFPFLELDPAELRSPRHSPRARGTLSRI